MAWSAARRWKARVIEVLHLKQALGLYEDRLRYGRPEEIGVWLSPEHRAIARQMGREAVVLLTEPGDLLPLADDARILVTGPLTDNRQAMLGEWSAQGRPQDVVTPCAGMQAAFGEDQVRCVPMAGHGIAHRGGGRRDGGRRRRWMPWWSCWARPAT